LAHFAKLDENNVVTQVIVVDNKDIIDPFTGQEDEILGIEFCKKLLGGNWKQTSYNNNMRVRYAGIGYSYNVALDAFVTPKPFASWVLVNETADWASPLGSAPALTEAQIMELYYYRWDEEAYQANNTTGWVLETPSTSEED
jgi:hypothetical protein